MNYLKYYGNKITKTEENQRIAEQNNAADIYDSLKQLKGSALKVAQMLSMDKNILPRAYVEKFSLAQFSVPPLSAPLVNKPLKIILKTTKRNIRYLQCHFYKCISIGQVHQATKDGKKLAVKIQYPGVAESISSDLAFSKTYCHQNVQH